MKIDILKKKRKFRVGYNKNITLSHVADLDLKTDELVTFISNNKKEQYDVTKKSWGYYATPSVNDRLKNYKFKTAIVKNKNNQIYIMLIHSNKMILFKNYLKKEKCQVVSWLDKRSLVKKNL